MNKLGWARFLFNILRRLPRKYAVRSHPEVTPFFVFGSGRNGSTMLGRMLDMHSELTVPSEQYFLGPSIFKFHYYNFAIWRDLVKIIVGELIVSGESHTWEQIKIPNLLKLYTLPPAEKSLQYLLDQMYRQASDKEQVKMWGDNTPLNTYYLPEIISTFPKGKYLFLIRDGRDVVSSYVKGGKEVLGDLSDPVSAAHQWMHSIAKYKYMKAKMNVKVIRYEDLVATPEQCLTDICTFLEVPFQQSMLDFNQHLADKKIFNLPVHENLKKPVFSSSIGSYQENLSQEEQDLAMPIIKSGLEEFGYL